MPLPAFLLIWGSCHSSLCRVDANIRMYKHGHIYIYSSYDLDFKATLHQAAVIGITAFCQFTQTLCIWKKITSGARVNRKSLFLMATPSICYRGNYLS